MAHYKSSDPDATVEHVLTPGRTFLISSAYMDDVSLFLSEREKSTQEGIAVRERHERVIELRRQGMTQKEIALQLDMTRVNVSMILSRSQETTPRRGKSLHTREKDKPGSRRLHRVHG